KLRTTLTIASTALALFLFAMLRSVTTTLHAQSEVSSAQRLITQNSTPYVIPLPMSYAARLSAIPHVTAVTRANWSRGKYGDGKFMFHYDYLCERAPDRVTPGWFILKIDDPNQAAAVARTIDDRFKNSTAPTKTGTEKQFSAGFASMWGNVKLLMSTIGMAVVFAILLVSANAMMMNQRERTSEVAVMKTVGFSDGRVFALVIIEAA